MTYGANAYARTAQATMSPRQAEAAVLTKAAQRLKVIQSDWENQRTALGPALDYNQKVWTVLAGAVAEGDNPLPEAVKSNIVRLSVFVFGRILDTHADPSPEKLGALVDINLSLATGLSH